MGTRAAFVAVAWGLGLGGCDGEQVEPGGRSVLLVDGAAFEARGPDDLLVLDLGAEDEAWVFDQRGSHFDLRRVFVAPAGGVPPVPLVSFLRFTWEDHGARPHLSHNRVFAVLPGLGRTGPGGVGEARAWARDGLAPWATSGCAADCAAAAFGAAACDFVCPGGPWVEDDPCPWCFDGEPIEVPVSPPGMPSGWVAGGSPATCKPASSCPPEGYDGDDDGSRKGGPQPNPPSPLPPFPEPDPVPW